MDHNKIYQTLFDSAAEGLVLVDETGNISLVNKSLLDMFCYEEDEIVGQKIETLIPSRYHTSHLSHRKEYNAHPRKRQMGQGMNLAGVKKNGEEFPVEVSLNHIPSENGVLTMGLITDISTRRKIEQENKEIREHSRKQLEEINQELDRRIKIRTTQLEESQKLYHAIAQNFPDGTINVLDKEYNYVFAEGREFSKAGTTGETLIGSNYLNQMPKGTSRKLTEHFEKAFAGEVQSVEVELRDKHFSLDVVPLTNASNEIERILVVERNITLWKQTEQEILRTLEKERELNELKTRFVSMASHEFRTPLGTILSSASLIGKYTEAEQQEKRDKHINRIKTSVSDLTSILNDFLSLEKLEAGKIAINPTHINVETAITEIAEDMQRVCKPGQQIQYTHTGSTEVYLDELLLKNILFNLMSNAIKYSQENTSITLTTERTEDQLMIVVKDEGIGIPDKDKAHLFERFFRAKNATNIQGTGLGLNIVNKYVSSMDGTIQFESEEGVGSTFSIYFNQ